MMDRRVSEVLAVEVVRGLRGQGFNAMRFAEQKFSLEASGLLVSCRILERAIECGMLYIFSSGSVAYRSGTLPAVFEMYWNSPECWTERIRQEGESA
ncbi:unnamed protein product [Sphagnum troendelagicum]|uniref:Uncharacterized protein n=1 Tax=Sphagnum troendelagicum TaxID=128251 RepID=A0ABP0TQ91_9BRYO